jgi:hypothetical protein
MRLLKTGSSQRDLMCAYFLGISVSIDRSGIGNGSGGENPFCSCLGVSSGVGFSAVCIVDATQRQDKTLSTEAQSSS